MSVNDEIAEVISAGKIKSNPGAAKANAPKKCQPKTSNAQKNVPIVRWKDILKSKDRITAPTAQPDPKWCSIPRYPTIIWITPTARKKITPTVPPKAANIYPIKPL